jgi:leader peptidase (prepilin peptidase) / N-methyltransferase
MIFLAESLFCFAVFYLIGSFELRGRDDTRSCAYNRRTLVAFAVSLILNMLLVHDPLGDQGFILPILVALTALLAVITLLDLEVKMLSDALSVILGLGGLAYTYLISPTLADMLPSVGLGIAMALMGWFFAGPYSKWRGRDMLGWGDVKFFAAAGLWLMPLQLPMFLIIAGLVGTISAAAYRLATGHAESPFAPALCAALWLCVVYGITL